MDVVVGGWGEVGEGWLSRDDTNRIIRERFGTARTYIQVKMTVWMSFGELAFSGRSFDTEEPDRGLEPGKDDYVDVVFSQHDRLRRKNQTEVWNQVKMTVWLSLGSVFLGTSVRSRITQKKSGTATTATGEDVWMSLASGFRCTILTD